MVWIGKIGAAQGKHPDLHDNISEKEVSPDNDPPVPTEPKKKKKTSDAH